MEALEDDTMLEPLPVPLKRAEIEALARVCVRAEVDFESLEKGPLFDLVHETNAMGPHRFQHLMQSAGAIGLSTEQMLEALNFNTGITTPTMSFTYPWPHMSKDAYTGTLGDIVSYIDPHTEADPVALLLNLMSGFGTLMPRTVYFYAGGQQHGLNLFTCVVGDSKRGKKGTALRMVDPIFERFDPQWRERVHSGLSTGEGLVSMVRDRREHLTYDKDGNERTVVDDEGVDIKQVLIVEEEFGGLLEVAMREGNTASAVIRKAWDGAALEIPTRTAPLRANHAHISIQGQITPRDLRAKLSREYAGNGFGNRFIWAMVCSSKTIAIAKTRPDYHHIASLVHDRYLWAMQQGEMRFDGQATALYTRLYPYLEEELPGLVGDLTSRVASQICRLSSIYALFDKSPRITLDHLLGGIAIMRYAIDSCYHLFGDTTGSRETDALVQFLRDNPTGILRREIGDLVPALRRDQVLLHTLKDLKRYKLADCTDEGTTREIWRPLPVGTIDLNLSEALAEALKVKP